MLRLHKNENVIHSLRNREFGLVTSGQKLGLNILFQLLSAKTHDFHRVWKHECKKRISCEDGKLYVHGFNECFSLWGHRNIPSILYRRSIRTKIVDGISCAGRQISNNPGPLSTANNSFRGFLLTLSNDNWLHSFDHTKGTLLQQVYLGPKTICNFTNCVWETLGDAFYVACSVKHRRPGDIPNQESKAHVFAVIAIFTVFPIEFKAMLKITSHHFGENVQKLNVNGGTLVVGTGVSSNGCIYLYDLRHVMENSILYSAKLNEPCPFFRNQVVGSYPAGLPFNCCLKVTPPLLFKVNCSHYSVHFGGKPWHYVVMKEKESSYEVRRISDNAIAENGFVALTNGVEKELVYFHYDSSDRIIFHKGNEIQVHEICSSSEKVPAKISHIFTMSFAEHAFKEPECRKSKRALRTIRPICYFDTERSILAMDYEDELDVIAILGFNPADPSYEGMIRFYDNYTGKFIKSIQVCYKVDESFNYELIIDLDTLVILETKPQGKHTCLVYKLKSMNRSYCSQGCGVIYYHQNSHNP